MKKLTRKLKRRLLYRARRQLHKVRRKHSGRARREESRTATGSGKSRPHRVTAWSGNVSETVICETAPVSPPARLCLVEAWSETLDFFVQIQRFSRSAGVKESANSRKSWFLKKRSSRGLRRIQTYLDFARIQHLSTAAALVITAEYDAACLYWNDPPPTINLEEWNPEVLFTLYQIGFFEKLRIVPETEQIDRISQHRRILKIARGTSGDELKTIAGSIRELMEFWGKGDLDRETRVNLNTAIGEAMANVAKWAYPPDKGGYDSRLKSFWITASADKRTGEMVIAIFDRGEGIPATYSRKKLHQNIFNELKAALKNPDGFEFVNDATYIKNAVKYGNSSSDEPHRGRGLPQMLEAIEEMKSGSLTIASRGGLYHNDADKGVLERVSHSSIGGTLVQWRLSLAGKDVNAG